MFSAARNAQACWHCCYFLDAAISPRRYILGRLFLLGLEFRHSYHSIAHEAAEKCARRPAISFYFKNACTVGFTRWVTASFPVVWRRANECRLKTSVIEKATTPRSSSAHHAILTSGNYLKMRESYKHDKVMADIFAGARRRWSTSLRAGAPPTARRRCTMLSRHAGFVGPIAGRRDNYDRVAGRMGIHRFCFAYLSPRPLASKRASRAPQ